MSSASLLLPLRVRTILEQGTPEQIQSMRDKSASGGRPAVRTMYEQIQDNKLKSKLQTESSVGATQEIRRDNLRLINEDFRVVTRDQLFHTTVRSFVDIQQYLFDNLCNKAISAKERIKEIERGLRHDFADTITEPAEIRKIVINQCQRKMKCFALFYF